MKLSEIKDEKAIEVIADLLVPMGELFGDVEISKAAKNKGPKLQVASLMLKRHPGAVREILAILNLQKPEEYHCNPVSVLAQVLDILNDKELSMLFTFAEPAEKTSSVSASTKEK